jgi:hypothetical protein
VRFPLFYGLWEEEQDGWPTQANRTEEPADANITLTLYQSTKPNQFYLKKPTALCNCQAFLIPILHNIYFCRVQYRVELNKSKNQKPTRLGHPYVVYPRPNANNTEYKNNLIGDVIETKS